jgi:hypothetical protein
MKLIKTATIGAAALAAASLLANAQTIVRYTGSTAYRSAVHAALLTSGASGVWDSAPTYGYQGTAGVSGANCSEFEGNIGGVNYIIKCSWTGSEAGIQTVDQGGTGLAIYLPDPTNNGMPTVGGVATALTTGGTPNLDDSTNSTTTTAHPTYFESHIPDVDMADTFQTSSQFYTTGSKSYQGHTYPALTPVPAAGNVIAGGVVGVVPFLFVASHSATFTNMTSQLARSILVNSSIQKSQFTGNSADTSLVYVLGRDSDSGTRLTTLAETGYGAQTAVFQNYPYTAAAPMTPITTVNNVVASVSEVPASTVDGISLPAGDGGYNSGGNLSKAMCSDTTTNSIGDLVTYLGTSDEGNAVSGSFSSFPCTAMTYNGVAYSVNNVQQGAYTFWGYEHMYYRSGSPAATAAAQVAKVIATSTAVIFTNSMVVNRTTDGATVNAN